MKKNAIILVDVWRVTRQVGSGFPVFVSVEGDTVVINPQNGAPVYLELTAGDLIELMDFAGKNLPGFIEIIEKWSRE